MRTSTGWMLLAMGWTSTAAVADDGIRGFEFDDAPHVGEAFERFGEEPSEPGEMVFRDWEDALPLAADLVAWRFDLVGSWASVRAWDADPEETVFGFDLDGDGIVDTMVSGTDLGEALPTALMRDVTGDCLPDLMVTAAPVDADAHWRAHLDVDGDGFFDRVIDDRSEAGTFTQEAVTTSLYFSPVPTGVGACHVPSHDLQELAGGDRFREAMRRLGGRSRMRQVEWDWDGDGTKDEWLYVDRSGRKGAVFHRSTPGADYWYIDTDNDGKFDTMLKDEGQTGRLDLGWTDVDGDGKMDFRWKDEGRGGSSNDGTPDVWDGGFQRDEIHRFGKPLDPNGLWPRPWR